MRNIKESAAKEAKRIEEDALYSAKSNFIMGIFWDKLHYKVGIPTVILAAIGGASAITKFEFGKEAAAILSIVVSILAGINTFINPQNKSVTHKNIGNSYNSLRNKARIFYESELNIIDDESLILSELKKLSEERDKLNKCCPHIYKWAFKSAKISIENGEADYRADG